MASLYEKVIRSNKIEPEKISKKQIRKENGLYIVEYGPILIDGKGIEEIQLIKGDVFGDILINNKKYHNLIEVKKDFYHAMENKHFEDAVRIINFVKKNYSPFFDEISKDIASQFENHNLGQSYSSIPYKNLLIQKVNLNS